jgi:hypothetical protein
VYETKRRRGESLSRDGGKRERERGGDGLA